MSRSYFGLLALEIFALSLAFGGLGFVVFLAFFADREDAVAVSGSAEATVASSRIYYDDGDGVACDADVIENVAIPPIHFDLSSFDDEGLDVESRKARLVREVRAVSILARDWRVRAVMWPRDVVAAVGPVVSEYCRIRLEQCEAVLEELQGIGSFDGPDVPDGGGEGEG